MDVESKLAAAEAKKVELLQKLAEKDAELEALKKTALTDAQYSRLDALGS